MEKDANINQPKLCKNYAESWVQINKKWVHRYNKD